MDLSVHSQMMLHHKTLRRLFIAPGRLTHIGPESRSTIIERLLLICSPPVSHLWKREIHHSAVSAPWPRHIIALSCGHILHEITETVRLTPLFLIGL